MVARGKGGPFSGWEVVPGEGGGVVEADVELLQVDGQG